MHDEDSFYNGVEDAGELAVGPAGRAVRALMGAAQAGPVPVWATFSGAHGDLDRMEVHSPGWDPAGIRAAAEVWAIGVLATGTARSIVDGRALHRTRICVVLAADATVASLWETPDGELESNPPETGRILEIMQRHLGLATSGAVLPLAVALGVQWLDAIVDAGYDTGLLDGTGTIPWGALVRLHPLWPDAEPLTVGMPEEDALLWALDTTGWDDVARRCAEGSMVLIGVPQDLAAWMDDAMLSRWAVDGLRSTFDLIEGARSVVPAGCWDRVMRVCSGDEDPGPVACSRPRRASEPKRRSRGAAG